MFPPMRYALEPVTKSSFLLNAILQIFIDDSLCTRVCQVNQNSAIEVRCSPSFTPSYISFDPVCDWRLAKSWTAQGWTNISPSDCLRLLVACHDPSLQIAREVNGCYMIGGSGTPNASDNISAMVSRSLSKTAVLGALVCRRGERREILKKKSRSFGVSGLAILTLANPRVAAVQEFTCHDANSFLIANTSALRCIQRHSTTPVPLQTSKANGITTADVTTSSTPRLRTTRFLGTTVDKNGSVTTTPALRARTRLPTTVNEAMVTQTSSPTGTQALQPPLRRQVFISSVVADCSSSTGCMVDSVITPGCNTSLILINDMRIEDFMTASGASLLFQ